MPQRNLNERDREGLYVHGYHYDITGTCGNKDLVLYSEVRVGKKIILLPFRRPGLILGKRRIS